MPLAGSGGDPMGTQPGVGILKEIYEAERQAERIVREAEAGAKSLIADAEAASRSDTEARREELSRRAAGGLSAQAAEIDREVGLYLRDRQAEIDRWVQGRRAGIDRIVDRLVAMVLPP